MSVLKNVTGRALASAAGLLLGALASGCTSLDHIAQGCGRYDAAQFPAKASVARPAAPECGREDAPGEITLSGTLIGPL